jgi:hypothetical protein
MTNKEKAGIRCPHPSALADTFPLYYGGRQGGRPTLFIDRWGPSARLCLAQDDNGVIGLRLWGPSATLRMTSG